ncbi:hypothetical protein C8R45DRAFT_942029 [Mycena sanguinolenta]|nr:hypothetical protein C8R45DRAFT_942029 [Mycena sanguinolenta]
MKFARLVFLALQAQILPDRAAAIALSSDQTEGGGFPCGVQNDTYCTYARLLGGQGGAVSVSSNTTVRSIITDPVSFLLSQIFFYRNPDIGRETYSVFVTAPNGSTRMIVAPTAKNGTGLMAAGAGPRNASIQSWNVTQEGGSPGQFGDYIRKYIICVPDQPNMCWSGIPGQNVMRLYLWSGKSNLRSLKVTIQNITRPPPDSAIFFLSFSSIALEAPDRIRASLTQHNGEIDQDIDSNDPTAPPGANLRPNRTQSTAVPVPSTTGK